jgi:hypothetical protein
MLCPEDVFDGGVSQPGHAARGAENLSAAHLADGHAHDEQVDFVLDAFAAVGKKPSYEQPGRGRVRRRQH